MPIYGNNTLGVNEHYMTGFSFTTAELPVMKFVVQQNDFRIDNVFIYGKNGGYARHKQYHGVLYNSSGIIIGYSNEVSWAIGEEGWKNGQLSKGTLPALNLGSTYYFAIVPEHYYSWNHGMTFFYDDVGGTDGGWTTIDLGTVQSYLINLPATNPERRYSMYLTGTVGASSSPWGYSGYRNGLADGGPDRLYLHELRPTTVDIAVDTIYFYPHDSLNFQGRYRFWLFDWDGTYLKRSALFGAGLGWTGIPLSKPYPVLQAGEQYWLGAAQLEAAYPSMFGNRLNNVRMDNAGSAKYKVILNAINLEENIDPDTFSVYQANSGAMAYVFGEEEEVYIGPILKIEGLDIRTEIARIDQAPGSSIEAVENIDYLTSV